MSREGSDELSDEPSLEPADLRSPAAQRLIAALNAELQAMYPEEGANHFRLDADEVEADRGIFIVVRAGGEAIGCGAIRRLDPTTFEVKRMFVVEAARGRGVSKLILARLVAEAVRFGGTRLVLETGTRQTAAIALYEKAGFVKIPAFGEYLASPGTSLCMARELAGG